MWNKIKYFFRFFDKCCLCDRRYNYLYIPFAEKDEDHPAKFNLEYLNRVQADEVMSEFFWDEKGGSLSPLGVRAALKVGLKSWTGVVDENGKTIKCTHTNFHILPILLRIELANEILSRTISRDGSSQ